MDRKFQLYINGVEIEGSNITFPELQFMSVVIKGDIDSTKNYKLIHNGIEEDLKIIGDDTLNGVIQTTGQIGYHTFNLQEDGRELFPLPKEILTKVGKVILGDFWAMIEQIFSEIVTTTGTFVYVDKFGRRHFIKNALFSYNWIKARIDATEKNILTIDRTMKKCKIYRYRKSFSASNININKTRKLLRGNPSLLVEHDDGIIINNNSYLPNQVLSEKRKTQYKTQENLQIFDLLKGMYNNVRILLELFSSKNASTDGGAFEREINICLQWEGKLQYLRNNTFLSNLDTRDMTALRRFPRTPLQSSNINYGNIYDIYLEYLNKDLEVSEKSVERVHSHIGNIEEIYKIYCAYLIANSFSLSPVGESIEERDENGCSFTNRYDVETSTEKIDLYVGYHPPGLLRTWTTAAETPDFIIHFLDNNGMIMINARYNEENGKSTKMDRMNANALMNAYNITTTAIFYPGNEFGIAEYDYTHGMNYKMLEIPVKPIPLAKHSKQYIPLIKELITMSISIENSEDYKEQTPKIEQLKNIVIDINTENGHTGDNH